MDINPVNGVNGLPPVTVSPPTPEQVAANRQIVQAVKAVNQAELLGDNTELTFSMDRQTQRPVIQLVDRSTKEVIRQIPPEYLLQMAADIRHE
jgi:flagellar protein FlaG